MTVNRKIIDALAFLKIPVAESFYDGKEEEYITFETPIDSGADFGDDEPGKIIVQVREMCIRDSIKLKCEETGRTVIVPYHSKDLKKGMEQAILKQAGLK